MTFSSFVKSSNHKAVIAVGFRDLLLHQVLEQCYTYLVKHILTRRDERDELSELKNLPLAL